MNAFSSENWIAISTQADRRVATFRAVAVVGAVIFFVSGLYELVAGSDVTRYAMILGIILWAVFGTWAVARRRPKLQGWGSL